MRESWTDDRLDELNRRVDDGFNRARKETKDEFRVMRSETKDEFALVRQEMNQRFEGIERRLDSLQQTLIWLCGGLLLSFVGVFMTFALSH